MSKTCRTLFFDLFFRLMPYMMSYRIQKKSKKLPVYGLWPDGNMARALEAVLSE